MLSYRDEIDDPEKGPCDQAFPVFESVRTYNEGSGMVENSMTENRRFVLKGR